jgi:ribosomal protein S19
MRKNRKSLKSRKIWSRRSSFYFCRNSWIAPYSFKWKRVVRCKITEGKVVYKFGEFAFTRPLKKKRKGKKWEKEKLKRLMARKGNPISVRLDLNRSSDPSRFSEGDREVTEWVRSVFS